MKIYLSVVKILLKEKRGQMFPVSTRCLQTQAEFFYKGLQSMVSFSTRSGTESPLPQEINNPDIRKKPYIVICGNIDLGNISQF